jgi:hypothetical protein
MTLPIGRPAPSRRADERRTPRPRRARGAPRTTCPAPAPGDEARRNPPASSGPTARSRGPCSRRARRSSASRRSPNAAAPASRPRGSRPGTAALLLIGSRPAPLSGSCRSFSRPDIRAACRRRGVRRAAVRSAQGPLPKPFRARTAAPRWYIPSCPSRRRGRSLPKRAAPRRAPPQQEWGRTPLSELFSQDQLCLAAQSANGVGVIPDSRALAATSAS